MQHLEERIAHLTRAVEEMSAEMARQHGEIERLTRWVRMLMEREAARQQEGSGGIILGDERPPHY
ncbi:SlyX family protein [Cribrihabitans sp. XS_ASV171]